MFILKILSRVSLETLYRLSNFLFFVSYHVIGYRRKIVQKNLRKSFTQKSEDELQSIEKAFYRNLCDYAVETIRLLSIDQEELRRRMKFTNAHILSDYKKQDLPVVILAAHQFNWEWLLAAGSFSLPHGIDFVYQPVNAGLFDRFALAARTRFGAYGIKREEVGREFIKRKHLVRALAIVADQYPGRSKDKKYDAIFLEQPTVFFQAGNQIAQLMKAPVVFAFIKKKSRGFYEVTFEKIAEPPYEKDQDKVTGTYIRHLEAMITSEPDGWLWSHNRWKKRHLKMDKA